MANGTYTNEELVDSIILDLNNLTKELVGGQYIQFCNVVTNMGKKLFNLRNGIKADIDSKDKVIEQLKEQLRNMGQDIEELTADEFVDKYFKKDGAN